MMCPRCGSPQTTTVRTANPFEDDVVCRGCQAWVGNLSHSRVFGPRFQEVEASVAKRKQELETETVDLATLPADEDEPGPEPVTPAVVEYPHCTTCGAVLALDEEKARGVCEGCEPLPAVQGEDAPVAETVPADVPLPFPEVAPKPFDFEAAFHDIGKLNRTVEARQRSYDELDEQRKDAKKHLEAAQETLSAAISEYDLKAREYEQWAERQQAMQDAYVEKLEADVAAQVEAADLPVDDPATVQ